jgi:hypothetical protein
MAGFRTRMKGRRIRVGGRNDGMWPGEKATDDGRRADGVATVGMKDSTRTPVVGIVYVNDHNRIVFV